MDIKRICDRLSQLIEQSKDELFREVASEMLIKYNTQLVKERKEQIKQIIEYQLRDLI